MIIFLNLWNVNLDCGDGVLGHCSGYFSWTRWWLLSRVKFHPIFYFPCLLQYPEGLKKYNYIPNFVIRGLHYDVQKVCSCSLHFLLVLIGVWSWSLLFSGFADENRCFSLHPTGNSLQVRSILKNYVRFGLSSLFEHRVYYFMYVFFFCHSVFFLY